MYLGMLHDNKNQFDALFTIFDQYLRAQATRFG